MIRPRCMLSHDLINKMFAIIAHCDELERLIPSPWCFQHTAKIREQARRVSDMLRSPQCTVEWEGSLPTDVQVR